MSVYDTKSNSNTRRSCQSLDSICCVCSWINRRIAWLEWLKDASQYVYFIFLPVFQGMSEPALTNAWPRNGLSASFGNGVIKLTPVAQYASPPKLSSDIKNSNEGKRTQNFHSMLRTYFCLLDQHRKFGNRECWEDHQAWIYQKYWPPSRST